MSWPLYLNFSNIINLRPNTWFIEHSKCQQFLFWKRTTEKTQIFHVFKRSLFRNGWPYFYECWLVLRDFFVCFLKCVILQLSQNIANVMSIWMSKADQNSTAFKKQTGCFSVFHLNLSCRTVEKIFRMALVTFTMLVVLKILEYNIVSMQNSLNATNCLRKQNFKDCPA